MLEFVIPFSPREKDSGVRPRALLLSKGTLKVSTVSIFCTAGTVNAEIFARIYFRE